MRAHGLILAGVLLTLPACSRSGTGPSEINQRQGPSVRSGTNAPRVPPVPPSSSEPAIGGRLAFTSDREGSDYIHVADAAGIRRLSPGASPAWSPDGRIAFHRPRAGIYVINADGSGERFLASGGFPDWSPDGRQIVFTSFAGPGNSGIFVTDAEGGTVRKLLGDEFAADPFASAGVENPVWSPDGRRIAFVRAVEGGPFDLCIMNADGTDPRLLTNGSNASEPSWSPDGSQLVVQAGGGLDVINADSGQRRTMIGPGALFPFHPPFRFFNPDWYSTGALVFSKYIGPGPISREGGGFELRIFVAAVNGAERQIIPDVDVARKYADRDPAWGP